MKVVINTCFGGFGLSDDAMRRYGELKGITFYPETDRFGFTQWWTVPKDKRPREIPPSEWRNMTDAERIAHNEAHDNTSIYDGDINRDDPALVQLVEELGKKANGRHASLHVVEIPDGVQYEIKEYDGNEHIAEVHRTWR